MNTDLNTYHAVESARRMAAGGIAVADAAKAAVALHELPDDQWQTVLHHITRASHACDLARMCLVDEDGRRTRGRPAKDQLEVDEDGHA